MKPVGILICSRLYESVKPAFAEGELSKYPVFLYPQHCSGTKDWKGGFDESVREISAKCRKFCILTCACPNYVFGPRDFGECLIETYQGAELLIPKDAFGQRISEGDYFLFPSESCKENGFSCYFPVFDIIGVDEERKLNRIIIPDTGSGILCNEFVRAVEDRSKIPVVVEKTGLDFFSNYLARALLSAENRILAEESVQIKKDLADAMMAGDMLGMLVGLKDEKDVIEKVIELFSILFSPKNIVYAGVKEGMLISFSGMNDTGCSCDFIKSSVGSKIPEMGEKTPENGFVLPVIVGEETVGIICVENVDFPDYLNRYRSAANQILPLCGLSVANARYYKDLNNAIAERDEEIKLKEIAEEALSKAIKKLGLLSSITRHDILNQIMVANYHLEIAVEDSPEKAEELSPAIKAVAQIQKQIEFTRDYQDMGVSPPLWHKLPLMIAECFAERDYPAEIEVVMDLPKIEVLGDPMLGKAFCNVISNAYIHAEGMTKLEISGEQTGENFIVRIADNGPGVPGDKKELIFKPGYGRIHGYGLFLVTEVFGITNLSIRECGIEGEGAIFETSIPPDSWRNPEK